MIRKISLLGGALWLLSGCAGMRPVEQKDLEFEKVVEVKNNPKDSLFEGVKIWVAENFRSAKSVIEYENKEQGVLIGNGIIHYPCSGIECASKKDWTVPFTMRVDVKDDKFKLSFSNLRLAWPASFDSTTGAKPAYDGPIKYKSDLDAVKRGLLQFGDEITASLNKDKSKRDW